MAAQVSYMFFGLLLCAPALPAASIPDYPFVFVVGNADVDTPPDIATCTLTLRSVDPDATRAALTVDARLK